MAAGLYDIIIEQYAVFQKAFQYNNSDGTPIDLSGKSGKMQVRKSYDSTAVLVELSTANGKMTVDNLGNIILNLTAEETSVLNWEDAVYDILIDGERILQGRAVLDRGSTHA